MTINPLFTASVLGMTTQSYALQTIGVNVANVNTGGYKRTDTLFQTVLSDRLFQNQDLGGVRPKDYQRIDVQGTVLTSDNDLDLAINGSGFFIVSPTLDADELFYTRDGSFQIKVDNQTFTTDTTGQSDAQTADNEGYLVDKNGYYLLGWVPEDDGTFSNTGTLQPLRVDYNYFANTFEATTDAAIGLNLPANNPVILGSQVDTLTIAGTVEAGDVYSVTVNGTTVSYTVTGLEANIAAVRSAIKDAINNNGTVGAIVNAAINSDGNIDLVSATPGTAFTATTAATNNGVTADNTAAISTTTDNFDHAAAVAQFVAGNTPDGFESYTFSVVDSEGVRQTVRLNFTKSSTNTWEVSATIEQDPVAQVDTVTLSGTLGAGEAGDVYTITIDGTAFSYTVTGAEASINEVRDALITDINANTTLSVTAASGGAGIVTLTADTAGDPFTTTVAATDDTSVAQVDTVTLAGSVEAGDTYSVTVNGTTVTYVVTGLEANLNAIRDGLVAAVNANATLGPLLTAAAGGAGQLTLTADTAGTPLTTTVGFTDFGGTVDNGIGSVTTTANVTNVADNTATLVNTTANGEATTTTTATTLTFTDNGVLDPATPLTYSLTFDSGATADFDVDITRLTQFASDFLPLFSESNGFEKSFLVSMQWDSAGHLIGNFGNENDRKLYKIPLATFINPNGLQMHNGMVFSESELSGAATIVAVDESGVASFTPNAREISNVRLEDEFARMIVTQAAYNASAMTFKTVDEMTMVARDLKA